MAGSFRLDKKVYLQFRRGKRRSLREEKDCTFQLTHFRPFLCVFGNRVLFINPMKNVIECLE